jgi:hypothetical protein
MFGKGVRLNTCVVCAAEIDRETLFCGDCEANQDDPDSLAVESLDRALYSTESLEPAELGGQWSTFRKGAKKTFLVTGTVVTILSMIVVSTLSAGFAGKPIDTVRACKFFSDGYQVATLENGSSYGMGVWRAAARDGAQYASGQLAFELQRFAAGSSDGDIIANIAELCR